MVAVKIAAVETDYILLFYFVKFAFDKQGSIKMFKKIYSLWKLKFLNLNYLSLEIFESFKI